MQIIVPMSGIGKRFIDKGYKVPKYLIEVDGKPILEHIVALFPGEENFIFICNTEDSTNQNLLNLLERIAPKCQLYKIPKHKKGPVFAVQQIFDLIDDADETIVNYCDFGTFWDYKSFLSHTRKRSADGAVVAYKGFHPHMLKNPNYAFIKESEQWLINIQEKKPFTENKMNEYASNGTYYFKSGKLMKKYFKKLNKGFEEKKNLQVKKLDKKIENIIEHIDKDEFKSAKLKIITLKWMPIGHAQIDTDMTKYYKEISQELKDLAN